MTSPVKVRVPVSISASSEQALIEKMVDIQILNSTEYRFRDIQYVDSKSKWYAWYEKEVHILKRRKGK